MSEMRVTDLVHAFNITVTYEGGPDGMPLLTAAPIRQRADAADYLDRSEQVAFCNGVTGIEAWIGAHLKREIGKPKQDSSLGWRERDE